MDHIIQRDLGNDAYNSEDYDAAVGYYTLAIGSLRAELFGIQKKGKLKLLLSSYYTSRAAALTKIKQYDEALEDCKSAIEFNRNAIKAYQRKARLYMQRGMMDEAMETYDKAIKIDSELISPDKKHTEETKHRFESARSIIEEHRKHKKVNNNDSNAIKKANNDLKTILKFCPDWGEARILQAEALFLAGNIDDAYELVGSLLNDGLNKNTDLLLLRARLMFCKGRLDDSIKQLAVVIKRDPDSERVKFLSETLNTVKRYGDSGQEAYRSRNYKRATKYYTKAIDACLEDARGAIAKLKFGRSAAYTSQEKHRKAIKDYTDILDYDPNHVKAHLRRGTSLMALKTGDRIKILECAMKNFERALELSPSEEFQNTAQEKLSHCQSELRQCKLSSKDYFAVLDLPRESSLSDVYDAYRERSLRLHNFKHSAKTEADMLKAERKLEDIKEAYEVLAEAMKSSDVDPATQSGHIGALVTGREERKSNTTSGSHLRIEDEGRRRHSLNNNDIDEVRGSELVVRSSENSVSSRRKGNHVVEQKSNHGEQLVVRGKDQVQRRDERKSITTSGSHLRSEDEGRRRLISNCNDNDEIRGNELVLRNSDNSVSSMRKGNNGVEQKANHGGQMVVRGKEQAQRRGSRQLSNGTPRRERQPLPIQSETRLSRRAATPKRKKREKD
mmetsp:Transcript_28953/g.42712  ORF Transcript_28953/g.42712 Transcript_28953/m.42712 type:complete len:673 (-) Transcript_28953:156-2174(-)|eukprot:CAMPEP_0194224942 /NCGR_PEP_ID=MMETSP0156-20130528/38502_1 /TAXON_ID=33649 /ORGANISM="Thalassionema nitzschioides, Strain L26-B" /LENGTH=672 /DNA_ID=CAMNT_0038956705 /DNA_START=107 /DNA_END=2125 /DNA_ORIENTATION=-